MFFEVMLEARAGEHEIALDFASDARLTALTGPSGVGKTSALNCIAGLARPQHGRIVVAGEVLFDDVQGIDLPPEKRRAGYVFQDARLFPHLRVAANLAFGQRLARPADRWIGEREVADLLGISHLMARYPRNLSGGETRRVAIARALLSAPRFLLLDEPLASLDPGRAGDLLALIERIRDELEIPILLVSHAPDEVARLAGQVIEMA